MSLPPKRQRKTKTKAISIGNHNTNYGKDRFFSHRSGFSASPSSKRIDGDRFRSFCRRWPAAPPPPADASASGSGKRKSPQHCDSLGKPGIVRLTRETHLYSRLDPSGATMRSISTAPWTPFWCHASLAVGDISRWVIKLQVYYLAL